MIYGELRPTEPVPLCIYRNSRNKAIRLITINKDSLAMSRIKDYVIISHMVSFKEL